MNFTRLFDILDYQAAKYPQSIALAEKRDGKWEHFSIQQVIQEAARVSAALQRLGVKKGDKVAVVSSANSPLWNFLDFGMLQIGVIAVHIYPTISRQEFIHIFKDAAVQFCFVDKMELFEKVNPLVSEVKALEKVFLFRKDKDVPSLEDLLPDTADPADFSSVRQSIQETDLATLIYTSGTTGVPKGVMLSHRNIVSNVKATITVIPIDCEKTTFSFLPLCHVFERMVVYTYLACGASVYYAENLDKIGDNIRDVRPHYFTCVPRILEKMYNNIIERGLKQNALVRKVFLRSIKLGEQYNPVVRSSLSYRLQLKIANMLVFRLWRKRLGGRVEGLVVGAAALQPRLGRLFSAAGIQVREGYGLTESSPVLSFNRFEPGGVHFGTVGIPLPGVEIEIAEDGEILARGPNIMMGYYKQPDLSAQTVTEDGWLHTGDLGEFVYKRFLKITGRKKDLFKTSGGKYVAPQLVEQQLTSSPYIDQAMVIGNNKPFVSALIIPSFANLKLWCAENKVHWTSEQFMVIHPKVLSFYEGEIERINQNLSRTEQVKKFEILFKDWSVQNGELTPTLKLKRTIIKERYQKMIQKLYSS